LLNPRSRR